MPYDSNDALPGAVKRALPDERARTIWRGAFNDSMERGEQEGRAFGAAYAAIDGASYDEALAARDNRRAKMIVESPLYQRLFPHVRLSDDQAQKVNGDADNDEDVVAVSTTWKRSPGSQVERVGDMLLAVQVLQSFRRRQAHPRSKGPLQRSAGVRKGGLETIEQRSSRPPRAASHEMLANVSANSA